MHKFLTVVVLTLAAMTASAADAPSAAANPELEKRVMALSEELRCLVCQNQTLADSHADLAIDLKNQVREKLASGMSDQDVITYMVERYGDFVLYRPPVKGSTWLLWFGPFILLVGGIAVLFMKLSHRRAAEQELPDAELKRAAALLEGAGETKDKA